jgi:hypothetical protein
MRQLKSIGRVVLTVLASSLLTITVITACGGGSSGTGGGVLSQARAFIFNSNPIGFHATRFGNSTHASAASPFVVNAQATTPGGGNFSGFCNGTPANGGRAAIVPFGLGDFISGDCSGNFVNDTTVGVVIPASGQVGQLTVDAVGQGSGADDGKVGISSNASGQAEVKIIHADGTLTFLPLSCTLGVSNPGAKVHCEDKNAAHNSNVITGDQLAVRFWFNSGDSYTAVRINVQYATPNF